MQAAVRQLDAAIGLPGDVRIVCDHQDRVSGIVQLAENFNDDSFVRFVEIACRLVGQNEFWLIDQRARDGHALLFAAGKLSGQMRQAVAEAHARQRFFGFFFVGHAVKILRQHHVFERREVRHEVKLLKNKAHFFRAVAHQAVFAELCELHTVNDNAAGSQRVQSAENVDKGGFP